METIYVYALVDPISLNPIYIGKAKCPISRFAGHLSNNTTHNPNFSNYLNSLKKSLQMPNLIILAYCAPDEADVVEEELINVYSGLYKLFNITYNPQAPFRISETTKKKLEKRVDRLKKRLKKYPTGAEVYETLI